MKNYPSTVAGIISEGGVVIIPTGTIYGFSCDPGNMESVERIKRLKRRNTKSFLILDRSLYRIKSLFSSNIIVREFIDLLISYGLWPCQITLIADKIKEIRHAFEKSSLKIGVLYPFSGCSFKKQDSISYQG